MILRDPLEISARLLPAVHIDDAWISLEAIGVTVDGRTAWTIFFDLPSGEFQESGLETPSFINPDDGDDIRQAFGSVMSFLGAAAESFMDHGENFDLFSAPVVEWAYMHSDEVAMTGIYLSDEEGQ